MSVTRQQVRGALVVLRTNRPRKAADAVISGILRHHGAGARTVSELDPSMFESVFTAAGGWRQGVLEPQPAKQAPEPAKAEPKPGRPPGPSPIARHPTDAIAGHFFETPDGDRLGHGAQGTGRVVGSVGNRFLLVEWSEGQRELVLISDAFEWRFSTVPFERKVS